MTEKFFSKALEANLAQTRYKNIIISDDLQAFINLSANYYGINKRAKECITEYLHPMSNHLFVVEQLRGMLLSDFWFYSGQLQPKQALEVPVNLYNELLKAGLKEDLTQQIIKTLLEFISRTCKENKKLLYPLLHKCLEVLSQNLEANKKAYILNSGSFIKYLDDLVQQPEFTDGIIRLVRKILLHNLDYWQHSSEIELWYQERKPNLINDFAKAMENVGKPWFSPIRKIIVRANGWDVLKNEVPVFDDIADRFNMQVNDLDSFIDQFFYLFYLLHLPGMQGLKDRLIWGLNKILRNAVDEVGESDLFGFIERIFALCEELQTEHISAVLDVILTLGKRIVDRDHTDDRQYVNHFEKKLIDFGFETPGIVYVNKDWQINVNENHIKNIRVWLELIEYSQSVMEKLLSALIVNLRLGGIFISDTDLFQREITKILNSNIAPYYKKVKQLSRIFPVYFNEIGAEGEIRNVTTNMDEIVGRQDRLIHFLRKQVHTESNNTLIELTYRIFKFWYDGNKDALQPVVPVDVFESIDLENQYFVPIHLMVKGLLDTSGMEFTELLELDSDRFIKLLSKLETSNETDNHRLTCIHVLFALLKEKYSFDTVDVVSILRRYAFIENEDINRFEKAIQRSQHEVALKLIFHFMEQLKKVIFNPETSHGWENIYHKRHIAIGIPSMYGTYREPKFEAFGLTFRLEKVATRLMEKIIDRVNLNYISAKTLKRIFEVLSYFKEGLDLDGIYNQGFNSNLEMFRYSLTSRSFSLHQYVNIFQFIAENVKVTIDKYFLRSFEYPLKVVIPQLYLQRLKLTEKEKSQLIIRKSEEFYRDMISAAFLVQPLDNFIAKILSSLSSMTDKLPPSLINDIMSYNSDLVVSPIHQETEHIDNQVFLGSKAYFLKKLYLSGFPVPPGFVLTTEVFRRRNAINNHPEIRKEMDDLILMHLRRLEKISGKQYGNYKNPLLLSVRSGTAISMPGAMDTFLNVGMNDKLAESLSKQDNYAWTSWDCYRRFLQSWGMAHGIHRDVFDNIMNDFKEQFKVERKVGFPPPIMKQVAMAYRKALNERGVYFEQDLYKQLKYTIECVYDSWNSDRAQVYRNHMQVADEWGTAVIVQRMILGNLNYTSGTGVVFTQNPLRERPGVHLYGDFTLCSQGEDIVGGLVTPLPVGETQRKQLGLSGSSLQTTNPEIYKRIHQIATEMTENFGFNPQEIEFTFESENPDDLYILQTRDQDLQQPSKINVFKTAPQRMSLVGRGIGIGGGAMNGIVAIDMDDLTQLINSHPGEKLILLRPDTVPDDIGMIFECDGLLTAKGGATSHAAVTAVKLGKTCVVNCTDMLVNDEKKECLINGVVFKPGDKIAIDGYQGNIFIGHYPLEITELKAIL
ncbi:MAG: PEP/pyruvate-binding domain-containing protein [Bacteroidales bacterium]|nr:PEP/pyruvate-binding domain-containing protein [Bacteroidales bacterium]MDZ4203214.1 PEP/pyruvate-binding domain-containing protein [Bacteroidales bacterium]